MNPFSALAEFVGTNIQNRKQSMSMAYSALKKQYGGALFGWAWSVVKPTVFIVVWWFGISIGIRGNKPVELTDGRLVPFIIWMIPGVIAWFFFQDSLSQGVSCVRKESHLVNKMVFPVATIPVFSVMSYWVTHMVMVTLSLIIFICTGNGPTIYIVQLLFYIPMFFLFCCTVTTFVSTVAVISRDFEQMIKAILNVFFWLTPVLWQINKLHSKIGIIIMKVNPFYYFVQGYRESFLGGTWFFEHYRYTLYVIAFMLVFACFTAGLQKKLAPDFADVL